VIMHPYTRVQWAAVVLLALATVAAAPAVAQDAPGASIPEEAIVSHQPLLDNGATVSFVFAEERPFAQCHASTIVSTAQGGLLAAWFAGTEESAPDVGIWLSRKPKGGTWSPPERVAKVNETAHWNPVLFRENERVYLFFKVGPEIPTWQTYWMHSNDHGLTWSEPVELVPGDAGGRGPVRNQPIVLSDGAWLAPASTELGAWKPFADRSDDQGATWHRSADFELDPAEIEGKGAIQPAFWESKPGHVHALLRTTGGVVGRTDSTDGGKTWSKVRPAGLPNNNSGIDAHRLDDGRIFLVYNPVGQNWGPRSPLNLAVSTDNGETWTDIASLESEPEQEFSYPCIIETEDGLAVSYTWKRQRVRVWEIPLSALPN